MAEERIFIKYYEDTDCLHGYGVERTVELTRQEAIERIAKALCGINEECTRCPLKGISCKIYLEDEGYMSDAKVALNALLEVE